MGEKIQNERNFDRLPNVRAGSLPDEDVGLNQQRHSATAAIATPTSKETHSERGRRSQSVHDLDDESRGVALHGLRQPQSRTREDPFRRPQRGEGVEEGFAAPV